MKFGFVPFLVIGISFIVLGINGQRAFFAIGIVFIILGLIMALKMRKR